MRKRISSNRAGSCPTRYCFIAHDRIREELAVQPGVRLDFDNSPDEAAPVAPIGVAQGSFQGDRNRGRPNVRDPHFVS